MKYLTVNTGDVMEWGRERLLSGIFAALAPTAGIPLAPIPGMAGFDRRICITADGLPPDGKPTGGMLLVVSRGEIVVALYGLATTARSRDQIHAAMAPHAPETGIVLPPDLPLLAALLMPGAANVQTDHLMSLADYAASMAMTMLQLREQRGFSA